MKEAGKAAAAGKNVAASRAARSCGDGAATGIVVAAAAWSEVAAAPLSMAAAAVGKSKPVEAGGSANEAREFELTLECKLQEVHKESLLVAEAVAAAETSDKVIASRLNRYCIQ